MGDRARLLVVEDDPSIAAELVRGLKRAGFAVALASRGEQARDLGLAESFDLAVLDLMLPGLTGFEVMESWQGRTHFPVIVLTAQEDLEARLRSFQLGAVDWLAKPFFLEELVARIGVRLGRLGHGSTEERIALGGVQVDPEGRRALRGEDDLGLTGVEFNLLLWLVQRPGRAISRQQLIERCLPAGKPVGKRAVDTHMARLRKKLGPEGERLESVWGIGYRYQAEESSA